MSSTIHAFDYLAAKPGKHPPAGVCALFGDEPLLKRLVLERVRREVLGDDADDVPYVTREGDLAEWRDVHDELATVSLFGAGKRLAVVDEADDFVSRHRTELEKYVAAPARGGVLVLRVKQWAANTRLYKALDGSGLQVDCRLPQRKAGRGSALDEKRLVAWLAARARSEHQIRISREGVEMLLELVGTDLGLLEQELAKLALYVDEGGEVTAELLRRVAGGWRTKTTWEIVDYACDGNAAEALEQLEKLLATGEKPFALFGAISWALRRFAVATRIYEQAEREGRRMAIREALTQAGFRHWPEELQKAERQLRQLGRRRTNLLYRWLLRADLAMKLTHSQDDRARLLLEQLFIRMSRQAAPGR
jgi:DNA polymerase-3 subunit delta